MSPIFGLLFRVIIIIIIIIIIRFLNPSEHVLGNYMCGYDMYRYVSLNDGDTF